MAPIDGPMLLMVICGGVVTATVKVAVDAGLNCNVTDGCTLIVGIRLTSVGTGLSCKVTDG